MNEYTGVALGFTVSQEQGSYAEPVNTSEWSPTITLRCPFVNRYTLIAALTGRAWPHGPSGLGIIRPIAIGFSIRGDGKPDSDTLNTDTQSFDYRDALVTVNYQRAIASASSSGGPPDPNIPSFDFFTEVIDPTIEYARLPHDELFWSDTNKPLSPEQTPGMPLYRERYTRTYFGIQLPISANFTNLQNHINNADVVSPTLGVTYPAQTVLYGNRRVNYSLRTDGSQAANLSLDFTFRQETWRKHWNFESQSFQEILNQNGDVVEFPPEADLSPILFV